MCTSDHLSVSFCLSTDSATSRIAAVAFAIVAFAWSGDLPGAEPLELIQQYCTDCHGHADESPEAGFSLVSGTGEWDDGHYAAAHDNGLLILGGHYV